MTSENGDGYEIFSAIVCLLYFIVVDGVYVKDLPLTLRVLGGILVINVPTCPGLHVLVGKVRPGCG